MKMAEKSLMLTFQNNCESINSNRVEVANHIKEKIITNNDITEMETIINKQVDEPNEVLLDSMDILTREDAVDEFLAGENKNEFNDDLPFSDIENDNEGISFKTDNVIMECNEIDMERPNSSIDNDAVVAESKERMVRMATTANQIAKNLKKRSIKCLNKMQIMEDVREGCNVQPSSPGHADQRTDGNDEINKNETHTENGFAENNTNNDNMEEKDQDSKHEIKSESGSDTLETDKKELVSENNHNNAINEENYSNGNSPPPPVTNNKRKSESEHSSTNKRLRNEIHENFLSRDKILNEFMEMADCNNIDQVHTYTEQVLAEIRTLNDLAKEKEREWNNIIHLKKIKEELLLRMQRKKQVMLINDKHDYIEMSNNVNESHHQNEHFKNSSNRQSILKSNLINPQLHNNNSIRIPSSKHRTILPRPQQNATLDMNGLDYRQNRQRPILDVQSIIADYRQRHPETVPRRGRRIRNTNAEGTKNQNSGILNFSSMALGSGSQVRQNLSGLDVNSELGLLLSTIEGGNSRPSSTESTPHAQDNTSFKDMLVQFARLSQSERNEIIQNAIKPPPPYPEVTVHPVPTTTAPPSNSLLHGILTKSPSKSNNKTSFSPTLARLLTAPERAGVSSQVTSTPTISSSSMGHPPNMSISEILSTSKARNEITITPVGSQYDTPTKSRTTEEEEAEDSVDRLVIDESTEILDGRSRADTNSDTGDEVPQCQGCNQKAAQFVCAGCGNQWYCSRECQVTAWDEHSEVCSG